MLEPHGLRFASAIVALSEAKILCIPLELQDGERQLTDTEIARLVVHGLELMRQACVPTGMENILPEIDRLLRMVCPKNPTIPFPPRHGIAQAIVHLVSRVQDELRQRSFIYIKQEDVRFYSQKNLFGSEVSAKFPAAVLEIEAAGNCLALQQPSACVFHLMRAMEVAVRQLSKRLKVPITPQTTWRQMTGSMDAKIRAMPEKTAAQKEKKHAWEEARVNLHHIGSAWRNNTMHPAKSYKREDAREILENCRVFMASLAKL